MPRAIAEPPISLLPGRRAFTDEPHLELKNRDASVLQGFFACLAHTTPDPFCLPDIQVFQFPLELWFATIGPADGLRFGTPLAGAIDLAIQYGLGCSPALRTTPPRTPLAFLTSRSFNSRLAFDLPRLAPPPDLTLFPLRFSAISCLPLISNVHEPRHSRQQSPGY